MISKKEVSNYLLENGFILTALEFHEELSELNEPEEQLKSYFQDKKFKSLEQIKGKSNNNGNSKKEDVHAVEKNQENDDMKEETISLLNFKLSEAKEDILRLKEQLRSKFEQNSSPSNSQIIPVENKGHFRSKSYDSSMNESQFAEHAQNILENKENNEMDAKIEGANEEKLSPITIEERQALNFLVQSYLKEHSKLKLTLITFMEEIGDQGYVNINKVLSTDGLLVLYRHFNNNNPKGNFGEVFEKKIEELDKQIKNLKKKLKEQREKNEELGKKNSTLITTLDMIKMEQKEEEKEEEVNIEKPATQPPNEEKKEGSGLEKKKTEVVVAAKISREKKRKEMQFSSMLITELFQHLPGIIDTIEAERREALIPIISLLLQISNEDKNNLKLFNIMKKPNSRQRKSIVENLEKLYKNGITDYFEKVVFHSVKKSSQSKHFEKRILCLDFINKFYSLVDEKRKEEFFQLLMKISGDFNVEVKLILWKTISNLVDKNHIDVKYRQRIANLCIQYIKDEINEKILKELLSNSIPIVFDWIKNNEKEKKVVELNVILYTCTNLLTEIKNNTEKKIDNYVNCFIILLKDIESKIENIKEEVENKEKRGIYFKWLLETGITSIINIIISTEKISDENSKSFEKILKFYSKGFGEVFHEKVLKRGFLMILENDNSKGITKIRQRLYPYYLCDVCNKMERENKFAELVKKVAKKDVPTYNQEMLTNILRAISRTSPKLNEQLLESCFNLQDNIGEIEKVALEDKLRIFLVIMDVYKIITKKLDCNNISRMVKNLIQFSEEYLLEISFIPEKVVIGSEISSREKEIKNQLCESIREKVLYQCGRILRYFELEKSFIRNESEKKDIITEKYEVFNLLRTYVLNERNDLSSKEIVERDVSITIFIFKSCFTKIVRKSKVESVVSKKSNIYQVCKLISDYLSGKLSKVFTNIKRDTLLKLIRSICSVFETVFNVFYEKSNIGELSQEKKSKKEGRDKKKPINISKDIILPDCRRLMDLFKDDNEIKKELREIIKLSKKKKKKETKNIFKVKDGDLKKLKNIFKKK